MNKNCKKYKLYWVYDNREDNIDPLTHGYIGVTSRTVGRRMAAHRNVEFNRDGEPRAMYKILKDIPEENVCVKEICWSYSEKQMAMIERAFRPERNIGWNTNAGGKLEGKKHPFHIIHPDGTRVRYETQNAVRADGYDQGTVGKVLRGEKKTFNNTITGLSGYTAEYVL